ncbi:MAG TPA: hypothetical protein VL443_29450 [Cyclobacteriaceae bacterium]|nr:hypothetical protein [Cyclobacteriaceae bacterium]
MPWALSDIRRKVRQVTGRLSSNELSTPKLDEYINNYYQYEFPAEVKLDMQHTFYEFLTVPLQQNYPFPNETYTNVEPFLYLNQRPMYWYQDPTVFKNENPINVQMQIPWTGDGVTTSFNTTVQFPFILPGSVIVTDNVETYTDDPIDSSTGNLLLTTNTAINGGTVGYQSGVISITFASPPANGQNIYTTFIQYQPGAPTAVLYYDSQFSFYPVPDTVYQCQITAFKVPDPLVLATDIPNLQEWGPCLAYGAARNICIDFGESERYAEITNLYKEQVNYILTRTVENLSNMRARPMW